VRTARCPVLIANGEVILLRTSCEVRGALHCLRVARRAVLRANASLRSGVPSATQSPLAKAERPASLIVFLGLLLLHHVVGIRPSQFITPVSSHPATRGLHMFLCPTSRATLGFYLFLCPISRATRGLHLSAVPNLSCNTCPRAMRGLHLSRSAQPRLVARSD
jgi:hypothetical protein